MRDQRQRSPVRDPKGVASVATYPHVIQVCGVEAGGKGLTLRPLLDTQVSCSCTIQPCLRTSLYSYHLST